jgi:hypothetical protein
MAPAAAPASAALPSTKKTAAFTADERERLTALWKTHHRSLLDVRSSAEAKLQVPPHPAAFAYRLYGFLVALGEDPSSSSTSSSRELQQGQHAGTQTPAVAPAKSSFVKRLRQSALREWEPLLRNDETGAFQLVRGRHILAWPHADFLEELVSFELQGAPPSRDYLVRDSYGAFLHHRPADALAALGCALGLAVTTLYLRHASHGGGTSDATTTAQREQAVQDYVQGTQFVVRFLHVQPQVPLRDIKTGLVGKFLTVQGHVVKTRTPRLRVATADFTCSKVRYSILLHCSVLYC